MENSERSELKKFTKKTAKKERLNTAESVKGKNREYFERKKDLSTRIEMLKVKIAQKEKNAARVMNEIKEIRNELLDFKRSKITQLLNYFEIRKLQNQLATKVRTIEQLEQDVSMFNGTFQDLEMQIQDRQELEEAEKILENFYRGQSEKFKEYEADKKNRDMASVSQKQNVVFIHATRPNFVPGKNSLLKEGTDWKTKIRILMAFEPTISTSTIREGNTWEKMFGRMGVILKGGRIESASPQDVATRAEKFNIRSSDGSPWVAGADISSKIEESVNSNFPRHNELAVSTPKLAGLYVCLEDPGVNARKDIVSSKEIFDFSQEYGLPVFALEKGSIFEGVYDEQKQEIKKGNKVDLSKIFDSNFQVDSLIRNKVEHDIIAEQPFNIRLPEMDYVDSRSRGSQAFIEMNALKNPNEFWGDEVFHEWSKYKASSKGERHVIEEIFMVGQKVQYLSDGKFLYSKRISLLTGETHTDRLEKLEKHNEFNRGQVYLGSGGDQLGQVIDSDQAYLEAMSQRLEELVRKLNLTRYHTQDDVITKWEIQHYEEWKKNLTYHLYGYGEEAGKYGHLEVQQKAFEIAEKYVSIEDYRYLLERRLSKPGEFRIIKEDLINVSS